MTVLSSASFSTMESQYVYVDNVNSNLICCICRMPFVKPMVTTACSHTFCCECIVTALSISPQCPVDRSPLRETDLQPANSIVRSLVDELTVECINRQNGCFHTCQRQLLATHLRDECEFVQVHCCEGKCQERILRKDVDKHSFICKHRIVLCRGCGNQVKTTDIEKHREKCPEQEIPCSYCIAVYPSNDIDSHEASCPDRTVSCSHAVYGCSWSGPQYTLLDHTDQCIYESLEGFLSHNARRVSFLEAENSSLRSRIESLEAALRRLSRDTETTKVTLGPWLTQNERFEAIRSPSPVEPASASSRLTGINSNMFGLSSSGSSPPDPRTLNISSNVSTPDSDPLSQFFLPHRNIFDAPSSHGREGVHRQSLCSSIAPLNLNTSLAGSLSSLRSSLISLASSLDSEIRRHDIALITESSRVSEEVMALRANVHGLRMQVHQIMMDRNSQVAGKMDRDVGLNYYHPQINSGGEFGTPSRYIAHPLYRPTNYGTSYIQPTKL